jgi:hypothetical protein
MLKKTLLPGRKICEQVWRGARRCLYQPKNGIITSQAGKAGGLKTTQGRMAS